MTEPAEVRTAFAKASHVRVTPMKARRVIDLIRDMPAQQALSVLKFAPQAASEDVYKVVASAAANATNNNQLDPSTLWVSEAFGHATDSGLGMDPTSSPALLDMTDLGNIPDPQLAFQANTHVLWMVDERPTLRGTPTTINMDPGSSPALVKAGSVMAAVVEKTTHNVWFWTPGPDTAFNTGLAAMPGSSVALTELIQSTTTP